MAPSGRLVRPTDHLQRAHDEWFEFASAVRRECHDKPSIAGRLMLSDATDQDLGVRREITRAEGRKIFMQKDDRGLVDPIEVVEALFKSVEVVAEVAGKCELSRDRLKESSPSSHVSAHDRQLRIRLSRRWSE